MADVRIALPNEGWVHVQLAMELIYMAKEDCGLELRVDVENSKPVDNCRNILVKRFLESDDKYLLFIDADNPPRVGTNPLKLVEHDYDIVGLPTPIWKAKEEDVAAGKWPMIFNAFQYVPQKDAWLVIGRPDTKERVTEVDAVGSGCILIARRVLEKVKPAFSRRWNEDGIVEQGSDLLFCKRAKEAGFKVWCAWDMLCSHHKDQDLLQIQNVMAKRDINQIIGPNPNTPEYWDEEWKKREDRDYRFYKKIAKLVEGRSTLDIGCGSGVLLSQLNGTSEGAEIAPSAVERCAKKGLEVHQIDPDLGSIRRLSERLGGKRWDVIVATEVLEHLDDDKERLEEWLEFADSVIYTVPHNSLPPSVEKEHRRVYTQPYVRRVTPQFKSVEGDSDYLLVMCGKEIT